MTRTEDAGARSRPREFDRSLVEAILEASPDGILVVDEREVIAAHNQRLLEVFNIRPGEIPGLREGNLAGRADPPLLARVLELVREPKEFLARVQNLYANPELDDLCEIELNDGRTLERHSTALWGGYGAYLGRVWFFRDITARKQLERTLEDLSHRDPLTGAPNRRHFFERADEEVARSRRFGRPLATVLLDIDHFKAINDHFGHAVGDRVLIDLCASVEPLVRAEDVFARLGGEEFALLLPDTDLDGAFELAERVRAKLDAGDAGEPHYTVSAGVAVVVPEDASAKRTLQRADAALYAAKRAGRNRTEVWRSAQV